MNPVIDTKNEVVLTYERDSAERDELACEIERQRSSVVEIPVVIGDSQIFRRGAEATDVCTPHDRHRIVARTAQATQTEVLAAVDAAERAQHDWARATLEDRAAIFLRAADLLAGPWRQKLNAATMLGQSKTAHQAEIDSACELIDFLRFNVEFARHITSVQPLSTVGTSNALEYRPLEGVVYAVSPFNFTAIGGNLACAPALMGNTVIWKPAAGAALSSFLIFELLREAGLPPGVINFVPGNPVTVSSAIMTSRSFAGLHFTGSTTVFDDLWRQCAANLPNYRSYPRLVGETGGKGFVVAHPSADVEALATALLRGAFEYQGQKCSAASRAYVPRSLWPRLCERLVAGIRDIRMGDVSDFANFMGAVIDGNAYRRIAGYIERARQSSQASIVAGGAYTDETGYFVQPTLIEVSDPGFITMKEEIFGPVLSLYVFEDADWDSLLHYVNASGPYALTGAVFAQQEDVIQHASDALLFAAGNFYVNDKPTGAVVGQQPFGGSRRSGTNDKAGSALNLLRWVSPRTIKETSAPTYDFRYPHMS